MTDQPSSDQSDDGSTREVDSDAGFGWTDDATEVREGDGPGGEAGAVEGDGTAGRAGAAGDRGAAGEARTIEGDGATGEASAAGDDEPSLAGIFGGDPSEAPERTTVTPGDPSLENALFVTLGVLFSVFVLYSVWSVFVG